MSVLFEYLKIWRLVVDVVVAVYHHKHNTSHKDCKGSKVLKKYK